MFQLLLLLFSIKLAKDLYSRYLLKRDIKDTLSVAYLSKHGTTHDQLNQAYQLHEKQSADIIDAYLGHKGALSDAERTQLENLRVYLVAQWQSLLDDIQHSNRKDLAVLPTLRLRDQEVIQANHGQWRTLIPQLKNKRDQLNGISLLPIGTSR